MPQAHKILGQSNPAATTLTTLYTVPSATQAIVSTIVVCNQASQAGTFRLAAQPLGAPIAAQHYLAWDSILPANDSITLTLGLALAATDVISVYASSTSVSFHAYGVEIT
jgi:hypothetical protein